MAQEIPPAGGYPAISYNRILPKRGPPGIVLFLGGAAVSIYGLLTVVDGIARRKRIKNEIEHARSAIAPVLQAEEDRRLVRAEYQALLAEQKIMSDVKNWQVGAKSYNTEDYIPHHPKAQFGGNV